MNYFRQITGRAVKRREFVHKTRVKNTNYSDIIRIDKSVRFDYGWRLSCGHVMNGEKASGKKKVSCYFCEWEPAHPTLAEMGRAGWTDITEEAYEAQRRAAQAAPAVPTSTD